MSRSKKKNPYRAITSATSEKEDKRKANRKDRRVNKIILTQAQDDTKLRPKREISNVWCMDKDGKFRFNPAEAPKAMRK